jgi:hypothetical protein
MIKMVTMVTMANEANKLTWYVRDFRFEERLCLYFIDVKMDFPSLAFLV